MLSRLAANFLAPYVAADDLQVSLWRRSVSLGRARLTPAVAAAILPPSSSALAFAHVSAGRVALAVSFSGGPLAVSLSVEDVRVIVEPRPAGSGSADSRGADGQRRALGRKRAAEARGILAAEKAAAVAAAVDRGVPPTNSQILYRWLATDVAAGVARNARVEIVSVTARLETHSMGGDEPVAITAAVQSVSLQKQDGESGELATKLIVMGE